MLISKHIWSRSLCQLVSTLIRKDWVSAHWLLECAFFFNVMPRFFFSFLEAGRVHSQVHDQMCLSKRLSQKMFMVMCILLTEPLQSKLLCEKPIHSVLKRHICSHTPSRTQFLGLLNLLFKDIRSSFFGLITLVRNFCSRTFANVLTETPVMC